MRHPGRVTIVAGFVLAVLAASPVSAQTPVPPPGKLSAGALSALVLKPDQTVWTWGINWNGDLGDGTFVDRSTPGIVPDLTDVIAVSKGSTHALALRSDGTVWSWGANWRGELGTGSPLPSNEPVEVEGLTDVVAISAGWSQGLALKADGTVWAWGANDLGQLGDGTQIDSLSPVQVVGLTDVTAIAAGWQHALALRSDGTVWAWGDNAAGELGDGTFTLASVPQLVPGLSGVDMIATSSNGGQSFARTSDGHVWAWGLNAFGELGLGFVSGAESGYGVTTPQEVTAFANAREISVGIDHTLVLAANGTVWAAGMNESGELGDGTTIDRSTPVQVQGLTDIAHVAAGGSSFSLALKADGTLYAWGLNSLWQFGDGTIEDALTPRGTSAPGLQWTAPPTFSVPGGTYSTEQVVVMASSTAGATIHYTTNGEDPTALDTQQPSGESVVIGEPTTLKARANAVGAPPSGVTSATYDFRAGTPIATPPSGTYSGAQTIALTTETPGAEIRYTTDGSEPTASSALYETPLSTTTTTTVQAKAFRTGWADSGTRVATYVIGSFGKVAVGGGYTLALLPDRTIWAWGDNWAGQLGDGTNDGHGLPMLVPSVDEVTDIAAGAAHSVARRSDGTIWTWGFNDRGQLGTGTTEYSWTPTALSGLTGIVAVSAGSAHTLALKDDGTVWAWGANEAGQLGDGTQIDRLSPMQVAGLTDVMAIASGMQHSLALRSDGSVWAWGDNTYGELGDGTEDSALLARQIPTLSGVNLIASGAAAAQSFARTADGRLWGWGINDVGELGLGEDGDTVVREPVEVTTLANVHVVSTGYAHTLAVKDDGTVWATGGNNAGQLGDGTMQDRFSPIQVEGLTDIVHVSAGWAHSVALKADGSIYAWGDNSASQLGDGTTTSAPSPTPISGPGFAWRLTVPQFSASSGTYFSELAVTLTTSLASASIHYTTNGQDPSSSDPAVPSGGQVVVSEASTLKAKAFAPGVPSSPVGSQTYAFQAGRPQMDPLGGPYTGVQTVALTTVTPGAAIRYTTDGSEPTISSPLYSTPLTISSTTTVRAKAFRAGWPDSDTRVATYAIGSFGMVAAGGGHTLALLPDGTVWAWGDNWGGQLGDDTTTGRGTPAMVPGLSDVTAVSVGAGHSVVRRADGSVWTWGWNGRGQLGLGTNDDTHIPTAVPGLTDVVAVSAGWEQTLALKSDGTVWAWGANQSGQLGDGTQTDSSIPVQVVGVNGATAIAAGWLHSLALRSDGTVRAWGDNSLGQIGDGTENPALLATAVVELTNVNLIATGPSAAHSFARTADGRVWGWGLNGSGELGLGEASVERVPAEVTAFVNARTLSAGGDHTLAVLDDGTVWATGYNYYGQLGDGTTEDRLSPIQVEGLTDIVHAAAGWFYSVALKADGTLYAWGDNSGSQLGDGTNQASLRPIAISGAGFQWRVATPVFTPAAGAYTSAQTVVVTCATSGATIHYTTSGVDPTESDPAIASGESVDVSEPLTLKARAFLAGTPSSNVATAAYSIRAVAPVADPPGGAYTGALSVTLTSEAADAEIRYTTDGSEPSVSSTLYTGPVAILSTTLLKAKAFRPGLDASDAATVLYSIGAPASLAAGAMQSFAVQDRALWAWGSNAQGQLGDGTTTARPLPVEISSLGDVVAVSTGENHTLALRADGTVWAWGNNDNGRLGLGNNDPQTAPVQVPGLTDVIAISAGTWHSLALKADGTVWGWGGNWTGQLGDGTQDDRLSPVMVSGLSGIKAIAAGWQHSVALGVDGTVWAWGNSQWGQVGDGTLDTSFVPKAVILPGAVDRIALGSAASQTFAHTTDGRWWGWGLNEVGQLGIGTTDQQLTPVEVPLFADMTAVSTDGEHTLALKNDGTVWATGWNSAGQLGDGTNEDRWEPVRVGALEGVVEVEAGWYHGLARAADGTIYAWGANADSQLGNGTTDSTTSPITVTLGEPPSVTATPTFSVPAGTYSVAQTIILTSATPGASVHYTTNGDDPTEADPVVASGGSIAVTEPSTVKARAYAAGFTPSAVAVARYEFKVATPAMHPPGGTYTHEVTLTAATPGSEIHYTTDGSAPDGASALYTAPIAITATTTLKAIAIRAGWQDSDVAVARYTITVAGLAAGSEYSLAFDPGGAVWAWGYNGFGQLGDGTEQSRSRPVPAIGLAGVVAVSAGPFHALAIDGVGTVWGWGLAQSGRLGLPNATVRTPPAPVQGAPLAISVAAAESHNLALATDGRVWSWGANDSGQLGDGTHTTRPTPIVVPGLSGVLAVAVGRSHSLALLSDGTVKAWGDNQHGQLGNDSVPASGTSSPVAIAGLSAVTAISSGRDHSLGLRADGTVWFWGFRENTSQGEVKEPTPVRVEGLSDIVAVAAGQFHNLAIKSDGTVWAWGHNEGGQLGIGTSSAPVWTPVQVSFLAGAIAIAGGGQHSLAITGDGTIWAWGANSQGQIGDGGETQAVRTEPVAITDADFGWRTPPPILTPSGGTFVTNPVEVIVGCDIADLIVRYRKDGVPPTESDATVACGGTIFVDASATVTAAAYRGDRRSATVTKEYVLLPARVAAGSRHFLYLDQQRQLWAWGENGSGQLGDGTEQASSDPIPVGIVDAKEIAAGGHHSLALKTDGTVWAWGDNAAGQLGRAGSSSASPVAVEGLPPNIVAIAAGEAHSLALTADGAVWSWGEGADGQLGTATSVANSTPTFIAGLADVVQIAAGLRHSLARTGDGNVWAWGDNSSGQLGDGSLDGRSSPVLVSGMPSARFISAGDMHSLAISNEHVLWGWGDNSSGQVSQGTGVIMEPEIVSLGGGGECGGTELTTVSLVAGGARHTTAFDSDSGLLAWGQGTNSEIGCQGGAGEFAILADSIGRLSSSGNNNLALSDSGVLWYWTYGPQAPTQAVALSLESGQLRVFPPDFSVPRGLHRSELTVRITAPTPSSTIHYTTNGDLPDETSPTIESGATLAITRSTLLQAMALLPGRPASDVRSSQYTLQVLDPVVTPPSGGQDVPFVATVTEATPEATLAYGLDAGPDTPIISGATIAVTPPATLSVRASRDGWEDATVFIYYRHGVVTPTITPPGGHFTEPVTVTIATTTPGVSLFYTVDGDQTYYGPFGIPIESGSTLRIERNTVLRVRGIRNDLEESEVATATFAFDLRAPTINARREDRADGPFYVTGASTTAGATVRCTTDGTEPNFGSPVCTRPLPMETTVTVKAKTFMAGWEPSPTTMRVLTVSGAVVGTPTFSLAGGRYATRRSVVVRTGTPEAVIHYTTDGTDPTASDPIVASGDEVFVDHSLVLKARAFLGAQRSLAATAEYVLTGAVQAREFVLTLKTDGTLWGWGNNDSGQVGVGDTPFVVTAPTQLALDSLIEVASGEHHTIALRGDGTVWGWGRNVEGQVGIDPNITLAVHEPHPVGLGDVVAVAAGWNTSVALKVDGTLWIWGVGLGFTPERVEGLLCQRIFGGRQILCVDGQGVTWEVGDFGFGRSQELQGLISSAGGNDQWVVLGNGGARGFARPISGDIRTDLPLATRTSSGLILAPRAQPWLSVPIEGSPRSVPQADPAVAIDNSTIIAADGVIWRWGNNDFGQVGDTANAGLHTVPFAMPGFRALDDAWFFEDADDDGLTNLIESDLGTDPYDADTNHDGLSDGASVAAGRDPVSTDLDGDGLSNADELALGTDPRDADSDGDGVNDGADLFPFDPSRSTAPVPDPADTTPPEIILTRPAGAVLVSQVP